MYNPTPQIDAGFYERQFLPKPAVTVAGYEAQYRAWLASQGDGVDAPPDVIRYMFYFDFDEMKD